MSKENFVIGVLGGMGTYATINVFKQYATVFSAEKEWDRPRIIIDNRCTMPSRVRAFLYNENVEKLVNEMTYSMQNLVNAGCNKIILACNTSHLFLPKIYEKVPTLKNKVLDIVDACVDKIHNDNIKKIYLLGSEGTIDSNIYQDKLKQFKIECIEAVKQNKYNDHVKQTFIELINRYDSCILGCTELPILYEMYKDGIKTKNVYDPLLIGMQKLKEEYEDE